MTFGAVRRAQLIAPFGTGAMSVVREGVSLICAGLDHWFFREGTEQREIDLNEYKISEWRLERLLGVSSLRLPPDYREKRPYGTQPPNWGLTVPFLRFPQWHYCLDCGLMAERPLNDIGQVHGRIRCEDCFRKRRNRLAVQVPFVAMCDAGHLQDFPWREWVHHTATPLCQGKLRLIGIGLATLAGQKVICDCKAERSLAQITTADEESSYMTRNLDASGAEFLCQGKRPWLGAEAAVSCIRPLRGSLRSATNVYYPIVRSSIFLPRGGDQAPEELVTLLGDPPLSTVMSLFASTLNQTPTPDQLRAQHNHLLGKFSDTQISAAIGIATGTAPSDAELATAVGDDREAGYRFEEYQALRTPIEEKYLTLRSANLSKYDSDVGKFFSLIMLAESLKETRALAGFSRVYPENTQTLAEKRAMLWLEEPQSDKAWLPASITYGEGIFLELNQSRLEMWLRTTGKAVTARLQPLVDNYAKLQEKRHTRSIEITPTFVLLHTFSHLLMNRLTFECGYSSASLRERIYVSSAQGTEMAGLLIYTAAGDADGTMGGLVRMGKHGFFEPVVRRALEGAAWCSADPVCMELGARGQGPNSCNLAACHSCALVPETACEEFNRFLDRALCIGDHALCIGDHVTKDLGYFSF